MSLPIQRAHLDGLVVFVAVAELRGFRAAARQLGVTPSAISQTIRALEQRVGAPLLSRTTRSVGLTEAGERLLVHARPAMEMLSLGLDAAASLGDHVSGRLRINLPRATTYSNAAIASTTAARIGPASATSGRSCALTAPTHCPMITNLRIWPRTTTRHLCVRNFIQSHDRSIICTEADRTEVPRLTCDYPRTRTGIPTAHRSMTLKTVTSIITHECNFRGGIT